MIPTQTFLPMNDDYTVVNVVRVAPAWFPGAAHFDRNFTPKTFSDRCGLWLVT